MPRISNLAPTEVVYLKVTSHRVRIDLEVCAKRKEVRCAMITLTPVAIAKAKELMAKQDLAPIGLRVSVIGGGCSGFSYHIAFEKKDDAKEHKGSVDTEYDFDGLKVFVDQMSEMYLDGVTLDYVEALDGAGFKFNNPNVKSTCGCGSSFSA